MSSERLRIPITLKPAIDIGRLFNLNAYLLGTLNAKPWQEHAAETMLFGGIEWTRGSDTAFVRH